MNIRGIIFSAPGFYILEYQLVYKLLHGWNAWLCSLYLECRMFECKMNQVYFKSSCLSF